jgi:hypothetical protein
MTTKNTDYAEKQEQTDYQLLVEFNEKALHLKNLTQTPELHHSDATGQTKDGKTINIEIKKRDITINQYPTLYIEAHKLADLYLDYVTKDITPLYVNFLNNNYTILFNLVKLKHRPDKTPKRIYSKLYNSYELSVREELLMEDAWIYKDGKLIKKGS